MADTILHKRNLTSGVAPTTESLSVGELAINVADRKLFTRSGSTIVILNDNTGSFTGSFIGQLTGTASFATSASFAPTILPSGIVSSSTQVEQLLPIGTVSSSAQYPGWVTASAQIDITTTINYATFSSSLATVDQEQQNQINALISTTSSYALQTQLQNVVSSSTQVKPLLPDGTVSSSVQYPGWVTASSQIDYNLIQNKLSGVVSSSSQFTSLTEPFTGSFTGSFIGLVTQSNFEGYTVVAHRYLELYPTDVDVAGGADPDSAYFYISGSSNDLWYTHKTDSTVNFDWIEGTLETGLLYGGIGGFSGSNVYIRSGSGVIVTHGANTGSAPSPTINYVKWPAITASIDVTNGFVTYLAIGASGQVVSQSTKFTSLQYHDQIPLGAVGHFNKQAIVAKGEQVNTQYSAFAQLTDFTRHFGPIKVGGYGITPQSGSLRFTRTAGDAFIYGGFYSQNPETPSNFQTPSVNTGSLAYIYRSGSGAYDIDANNNNFYTEIKPGFYDDGSGTLAALASNEWSIQRVFIEPVTGIHYIYYGQNKYTSLANALSNLTTDSFAEGPATTLFTVFIGYIIAKGNTTNLFDTTENSIVNAGLFRNTSAGSVGGGAVAQLLNDLSDVSITSAVNGEALIYNSGNWINGIPSSASFAQNAVTASAATSITFTPTTASFATTASAATSITFTPSTSSFSITSSFATTASAATSITFTPTSASFATTASAATSITFNPTSASFATTSSFATSASFAPYTGLRTKAGAVTNTSFAGNPRKATVTFTTAFPNTSYAVTVTGEDARSWTIESKVAGSFVINANSNTNLAGTTYWVATAYGET